MVLSAGIRDWSQWWKLYDAGYDRDASFFCTTGTTEYDWWATPYVPSPQYITSNHSRTRQRARGGQWEDTGHRYVAIMLVSNEWLPS